MRKSIAVIVLMCVMLALVGGLVGCSSIKQNNVIGIYYNGNSTIELKEGGVCFREYGSGERYEGSWHMENDMIYLPDFVGTAGEYHLTEAKIVTDGLLIGTTLYEKIK